MRRATSISSIINNVIDDFYPRSPCGERPKRSASSFPSISISIHALLAESDGATKSDQGANNQFLSTLSLRRATQHSEPDSGGIRFLSTLSLRRATPAGSHGQKTLLHFYPRSPCGERHGRQPSNVHLCNFYPRSPCGERPILGLRPQPPERFLSTLSLRRATLRVLDGSKSSIISIHALLAESDRLWACPAGCVC